MLSRLTLNKKTDPYLMDAQVSKLYLGFSLGMGMFVFSMITSYGVTYPKFTRKICMFCNDSIKEGSHVV